MAEKLPNALRKDTEGRGRSESYTKRRQIPTARLFTLSGCYTVGSIRTMREQARQYFLADPRKGRHSRKPLSDLRSPLEISDLSAAQKKTKRNRSMWKLRPRLSFGNGDPRCEAFEAYSYRPRTNATTLSSNWQEEGVRNIRRPPSSHLKFTNVRGFRTRNPTHDPSTRRRTCAILIKDLRRLSWDSRPGSHTHSASSWKATSVVRGTPSAEWRQRWRI